jgi:hypothetical protein
MTSGGAWEVCARRERRETETERDREIGGFPGKMR